MKDDSGSKQDKDQPVSYESVRPFLKASLEQIISAGRGVRDMAEFSAERLGDKALPLVNRFLAEVRSGQVKIKGLTDSVHQSLFDGRPSPEERERLIREAAYLRAEQRGFVGGSPEEDWVEAEREIDERLAAQEGLIARGRHAIESGAVAAESGAEATYGLVRQWLAGREQRTEEAPRRLDDKSKSSPEDPKDSTAAGSASEPGPTTEEPAARTRTRRAAPRAKKEGQTGAPAKAAGTRARKPRSPKTPPTP
ncbi:DUF2934 domain-containing protein [Thioalkalivibrio sp.]|uniref:DUF2934 domain-containing protein n=1 Tax=Thioalkalivibrio sp. TaxID=2093813 RepID=UPI003564AC22